MTYMGSLVLELEATAMRLQSVGRDRLGRVMEGRQVPAGERDFISPRFLAGIVMTTAAQDDSDEKTGMMPLLAGALANCGTVPSSVLEAARPEASLREPGVYSVLTEKSAFVVWRVDSPGLWGRWMGGRTYAMEVVGSPELKINLPPYKPSLAGHQVIGFINQNGVPPPNELSGIYKVSHYNGKWVKPRIIRLLENYHPDSRPQFNTGTVLGMCKESGCAVYADSNIGYGNIGPFAEVEDYLLSGAELQGNFMGVLVKAGLKQGDHSTFINWLHGFNALWLCLRVKDGTVEGSVQRHMLSGAKEGVMMDLFEAGFMDIGPDGQRNTQLAAQLNQFPGISSHLCRWPNEYEDTIKKLSRRRYQMNSSYGHPLLWEATTVALMDMGSGAGWHMDEITTVMQLFMGMVANPLGEETDPPLYISYLAPGLAEAFLNSDAPQDCTLAEMGLPFPRMRIMLPKGLCRFKTDFGYCDAHSVYLEKNGDFLHLGGICEGSGGTKVFLEKKPWVNTIAGFIHRGSARQFDLTLKKAYRKLDARWNAYESGESFGWLGLPDEPGDEERVFWEGVWSVVAQMLLMMTMRPDWTTPEFQERKEKIKHGRVVRDALWQPNIYGAQYQVRREPAESYADGESAAGTGKRFHWRRGHWRNQAHGEGRALRKFIWLEPMAIGAPE